jgi:DNA-binding transcriptional LysR family regulator
MREKNKAQGFSSTGMYEFWSWIDYTCMMGDKLPSANQIEAIAKILETGNFSSAALEMGITQSAVSRLVRSVEEEYGVELFLRGRNGAAPTVALQRLLPAFRRAQEGMEELARQLSRQDGVLRGRIRVAAFRSAATQLLSQPLKSFLTRHPKVDVALQTVREVDGGIVNLLMNGRADIGVTTDKPPRGVRSWPLLRDEYVLVRDRIRSKKRASPKGDSLILWKERCSEVVPQILQELDWQPKKTIAVDADAVVLSMVESGAGFTVMPRMTVEPLSAKLEMTRLPVTHYRQITLCALPTVAESQAASLLLRQIRSSVRTRFRTDDDTGESERRHGATVSFSGWIG